MAFLKNQLSNSQLVIVLSYRGQWNSSYPRGDIKTRAATKGCFSQLIYQLFGL